MVSTAGIQFQPLSNDTYIIPKAQILFRPEGQETFELLGDTDEVTLATNVEETERYTNEAGIRLLALTVVTQVDAELGLTLVQLTDRNRALSLLGLLQSAEQTAFTAKEKTITGVDTSNKVYQLDGDFDVTVTGITDGGGLIDYVEGVDYRVDRAGGWVNFTSTPAGADADAIITYDGAEVLTSDERALVGIASRTENRGTVIIRGTNEVGPRVQLTLHDVQLRPDGERNYVSETDFDTIEVIGRVFRDETKSSGLELGFEQRLSDDLV